MNLLGPLTSVIMDSTVHRIVESFEDDVVKLSITERNSVTRGDFTSFLGSLNLQKEFTTTLMKTMKRHVFLVSYDW